LITDAGRANLEEPVPPQRHIHSAALSSKPTEIYAGDKKITQAYVRGEAGPRTDLQPGQRIETYIAIETMESRERRRRWAKRPWWVRRLVGYSRPSIEKEYVRRDVVYQPDAALPAESEGQTGR